MEGRGGLEAVHVDVFAKLDEGGDFGDVHAGFGGELVVDVVEGSSAGFAEQFGDAAFAAVVGGEGEGPVAKAIAEGFEIFCGGAGIFDGVEAFIFGG